MWTAPRLMAKKCGPYVHYRQWINKGSCAIAAMQLLFYATVFLGSVVETAEFGLKGKSFDLNGENLLKHWISRSGHGRVVVAIGNGKASFETQMAVAEMIRSGKFMPKDVKFCTVPENGASKYSVTPLAEQDLPNMPPTQRSAVSIGRRLIDPMAEYVKIEPKHLGMGMYQHSVNTKRLSETLELVVRECVSMRGVDVNLASVQLLEKVCGLNKKTAAGLVALREKMGRIQSREDIRKVKGLGMKSFEQCAGEHQYYYSCSIFSFFTHFNYRFFCPKGETFPLPPL
ncbi:unnamed protein product [Haemonchus placei]|uniref:Tex_YqgF domain-containing protein n=1 Tax=Haemonchus placei TaxID=6290 RepID=A0A0N4WJU3_HAEPC|nr:unnamed protein product [Haemonchus placei]